MFNTPFFELTPKIKILHNTLHEKFQKLQVSVDFSTKFLLNSLDSAAPPIEPPINICPNFGEKFDKILKCFEKLAKIPLKLSKNSMFPLIFRASF